MKRGEVQRLRVTTFSRLGESRDHPQPTDRAHRRHKAFSLLIIHHEIQSMEQARIIIKAKLFVMIISSLSPPSEALIRKRLINKSEQRNDEMFREIIIQMQMDKNFAFFFLVCLFGGAPGLEIRRAHDKIYANQRNFS